MSKQESWNHWKQTGDYVAGELRRMVEVRYDLAASVAFGTVYDAGCGHGYGAFRLYGGKQVTRIIAMDRDGDAVAVARHHMPVFKGTLSIGDIEQMPVPPCQWMVCTEVLEHLYDAEAFLAKAKEKVTDGMVLSWPLGKTGNKHHNAARRDIKRGDLQKLVGDWEGEKHPLDQNNPEGKSIREHELGVFRKPR